jgi:hypothetical protein
MSKPAASNGEGAASRSLFRACKQPSKASSRAVPGQHTLRNPPHSDKGSDGGRSENLVSDSDDSLVSSAVSREAGDLVSVQLGGNASAAVSCEHPKALSLSDDELAPRQELGDSNLVPQTGFLAEAETDGLASLQVLGSADDKFAPHPELGTSGTALTRTFLTEAHDGQASFLFQAPLLSVNHAHIASDERAPSVPANQAYHPFVAPPQDPVPDATMHTVSQVCPIIQGFSNQLSRLQAELDRALELRIVLDPSVAVIASDESNEGYPEALSVLTAAAAAEKRIQTLNAQVLSAQRQLSQATQIERER